MASTGGATQNGSLSRTAVGLAGATVLTWVVLAALDHDGPGWMAWAALGAATAVTAWRAGGASPRNAPAFVALIVGVVTLLVFAALVITGFE
jgi:hypothetical protein